MNIIQFEDSLQFAQQLDSIDPLKQFKDKFHFPKSLGKKCIYLCGNSLGLQPKQVRKHIDTQLESWANFGVKGHQISKNPWLYYHKYTQTELSQIVGSKISQVVAMGSLTTNLHLLMVSFYRPTQKRYKIVLQDRAFPSDQYAFVSQLKFHGFDESGLIKIKPREGEYTLRTEDIIETIKQHANEISLVLFGGVNYYTGQFFDMKAITQQTHKIGAICGFDLAHAVGNVILKLHDWNVDFATWCSYKYLNSSPGGVSGIFVHQKHHKADLPRFNGWWGHKQKVRFKMEDNFQSMGTVQSWQTSNGPVILQAILKASLQIFQQAGMQNLREKSILLTGFLYYLLTQRQKTNDIQLKIITPKNPEERGCQLSLLFNQNGKEIFNKISQNGVVGDWREPGLIRVAPVPLYNSFEQVYIFANQIFQIANQLK